MKPTYLSLIMLCISINSVHAIVIHQVLYDPVGSENGGEAVELYNDQESAVDVSNWVLKTKSSETDATLPPNTIIFPGEYFLVADRGWNESKDDPSWRAADYEEPLTLSNTNAGVALKNNSIVIDAVGWGTPVDPELFEGTPSNGTGPGESLLRVQESDDNLADFGVGVASFPERPRTTERIDITIPIMIPPVALDLTNVTITDDLPDEGYQVVPRAGGERVVDIVVTGVAHVPVTLLAEINLGSEVREIDLEGSSPGEWKGNLSIPYFIHPGIMPVTILASTSSEQSVLNSSFEWLSVLALQVDSATLELPEVVPGSIITVLGDEETATTHIPTIKNIGNTFADIGVRRTALQEGSHALPGGEVKYSLDNNFDSVWSVVVGEQMHVIPRGLQPGEEAPLGLQIVVPSEATEEVGMSTMITAVAAE